MTEIPDEAIAAIRASMRPDQLLLAAMRDAIDDALVGTGEEWADGTRPPKWRDAMIALAMFHNDEGGPGRLEDVVSDLFDEAVAIATERVIDEARGDFAGTLLTLALRTGKVDAGGKAESEGSPP